MNPLYPIIAAARLLWLLILLVPALLAVFVFLGLAGVCRRLRRWFMGD
jgi:hypothetical protein